MEFNQPSVHIGITLLQRGFNQPKMVVYQTTIWLLWDIIVMERDIIMEHNMG